MTGGVDGRWWLVVTSLVSSYPYRFSKAEGYLLGRGFFIKVPSYFVEFFCFKFLYTDIFFLIFSTVKQTERT